MVAGMIRAGDLDREVRFERKAPSAGFMSAGQEAWEEVATVWAQVQDVLPRRGERTESGLTTASRQARIRTWYRDDITADMRVVHGERVMQIIAGPVELGRLEGIELVGEDYSTAGEQA